VNHKSLSIAIDVSPLTTGHYLSHRVRGTGFYLKHLKDALLKHYPDNEYSFFSRGENIHNVDLVHYPYFEPFFLTLPQRSRQKYVVTVHDLTPLVFPDHFPAGIKGRLKWKLQKRALKNAEAIITDSDSSRRDIVKYADVDASKVSVVYLAAGEEFGRLKTDDLRLKTLRKKFSLPENFILYVGDVTWNKNLPRLIDAVKKTKIPLVMVGKALLDENFDRKNPWNQDLAKVWEETKDNKQFIRLGFVSNEDLVSLYSSATVFVMPSIYEGFGLPVLEAMACGCPVVTTREGSLPEVAGEAAYYVDAKDADSIVKGIEKVSSDEKLRSELSKKGLEQAKKFSWRKTAEDTMGVYKKILKTL
jgi:glycosyltransferase involved in cell wall biosynthesis